MKRADLQCGSFPNSIAYSFGIFDTAARAASMELVMLLRRLLSPEIQPVNSHSMEAIASIGKLN